MNTIEIELRYEILNHQELADFLKNYSLRNTKHDTDEYYDTVDRRLYKLGIFIRARNNKKLEIKFNRATLDNPNLPIQDYCEEHTFILPLIENELTRLNELLISLKFNAIEKADFSDLMRANNFEIHYTVDKMRTTYQHDSFTICIDQVANLGTFLEIELMARDISQLEDVKMHMALLLKGLSLQPLKTGYGTLLLRKKDFQEYLQGRFILPEDRALSAKNYL